MSEVLTRSIATTSCTLVPIIALLLFGGATLRDFAFALLIGVASGAYSSIFIASPVLTHWKERELLYRTRRHRIETEAGHVPAYATSAADVEPDAKRGRREGRLTAPEPETVSAAEFERMKQELEIEPELSTRHTSTLTKRLAHTDEPKAPKPRKPARPAPAPPPAPAPRATPASEGDSPPAPAPDIPENEGMAQMPPKPKSPSKSRPRNRRHGRRR
jgi:SecD/SecF fusion protein